MIKSIIDYYVKNGSNMRIGTIMAIWNSPNVTYTDYCTADLGDTTGIEFTVDISGSSVRLNAIISSGTWTITTSYRYII